MGVSGLSLRIRDERGSVCSHALTRSDRDPELYTRYVGSDGDPHAVDALTERFISDDHPITVEIFAAEGAHHPGILLLHGANGLATAHGPHRRLATIFAESGYAVFFVHYFTRTETVWADRDTVREYFLVWRKTIRLSRFPWNASPAGLPVSLPALAVF
jgi:hypothetical protein